MSNAKTVMFDWMLNRATPLASYRVSAQSAPGADQMSLVEQHQYVDGRVRENAVQFYRNDSGAWQQVIPQELMPKLQIVLNDLARLSSSGGK
jgi:hypothetical protein